MKSKDLTRLQGTWHLTSMEVDGAPPPGIPPGGAKLVVTGSAFVSTGMGAVYEGVVILGDAKDPKTITLQFTAGHAAGTTNHGIYRLDDEGWTMCLAADGGQRPRTFATKPGSGLVLEKFRRVAPKMRAKRIAAGDLAGSASESSASSTSPVSTAPATDWEGEFAMVSGIFGGSPMSDSMISWASRVTRGDVTSIAAGPQVILKAQFNLDTTRTPNGVEYMNLAGSNKGKKQKGIFRMDGDLLEVCMAAPGKARPDAFVSKRGDGRSHTTWRRKG